MVRDGFKSADDGTAGIETTYLPNEPNFAPDTNDPTWKRIQTPIPTFSSQAATVGFAFTAFLSPCAQAVTLSLSSDDGVKVYLNGRDVFSSTEIHSVYLDQYLIPASLQAGTNTLLLKVENWTGPHGAAARFLPPGLDQPLLQFRYQGWVARYWAVKSLPNLRIKFFDQHDTLIDTHYTSGTRHYNTDTHRARMRAAWRLFAEPPETTPTYLTISALCDERVLFTERIDWQEALHDEIPIFDEMLPPLVVELIDSETKEPIEKARFIDPATNPTQERGFLLEHEILDGMYHLYPRRLASTSMAFFALGYHPNNAPINACMDKLKLEMLPNNEFQLSSGNVFNENGRPIQNARVITLSSPPEIAITDAQGQYDLYGTYRSATPLNVKVTHPEYAPLNTVLSRESATQLERITLTRGADVQGAIYDGSSATPLPHSELSGHRFADEATTITQANEVGIYRIKQMPAGQQLLIAEQEGYAPKVHDVALETGETTAVHFALSEGQDVTGYVVNTSGAPLRGAWIEVRLEEGLAIRRRGYSDTKGFFRIKDMPSNPSTVTWKHVGYHSIVDTQVIGGDFLRIVMEPITSNH